jgi:hypothetical protein
MPRLVCVMFVIRCGDAEASLRYVCQVFGSACLQGMPVWARAKLDMHNAFVLPLVRVRHVRACSFITFVCMQGEARADGC